MRTKTVLTRALGTAAATAVAAGLTALSAPAAGAATQTVVDSCTSTASAPSGATVLVDGASLKGPVEQGAREADRFLQFTYPKNLADEIGKHKLDVGTVPNKAAGVIGGADVADAVVEKLEGNPALGWPHKRDDVLASIHRKVAGVCGLSVESTDRSKPTSSQPQQSPNRGSTPQQGGSGEQHQQPSQPVEGQRGVPTTPDGPQGSGDGYAAPRDYSNIPEASVPTQGSAVPPDMRYSPQDGVPGAPDSPEYGVLSDGGIGEGGKSGAGDVRNAGNADALAADDTAPNQVQLPMLLAVVALAGVTAGLVRTWVLRKTT
ncbi:hypothetical protein FHS23_000698 [Prauserella isguenensis]|uniref:Uncharacterized protein n=1 Tax=Prauserella isguenensis TaxID=1470180 RepID=A0A839RX55_9PSEU|nr:hypothetical protein [Prauserella isguenensis]MBB3049703.1 hypothetical protein [Prauserella isguenensis]